MDIFDKIQSFANMGYTIDYMAVDQISNGHKKDVDAGHMPRITFTVVVTEIENDMQLYAESFDTVKDALDNGVRFLEKYKRKEIDNV